MQPLLRLIRIIWVLGCVGCVCAPFWLGIYYYQPIQRILPWGFGHIVAPEIQVFVLWVICTVGVCWGYAATERAINDYSQRYQTGVSLVLLVLFGGGYIVSTGVAMFFFAGDHQKIAQNGSMLNIPLLIVIVNTASFNAIYWQFNHLLNLRKGIAYRLSGNPFPTQCVERPFDVWMGLATCICSLGIPLLVMSGIAHIPLSTAIIDIVYVLLITLTTIVSMIVLGLVRGLHSITAIMWMGMHNLIFSITILLIVPQLPDVEQCIKHSMRGHDDVRTITALCVDLSQFWLDKWLTTIFAFIAIFGAALLASYSVDIKKLGWESHELQYQNLALVFTLSAIIILIESVILLGIPLMNTILAVKSF